MSPPATGSTASVIKESPCPDCGKVFGRVEHLRRHILIHTKERSFPCRDCPKQFVRRDALKRHELTHRSAPNLLKRGARACTQCAAAKSRCSGDEECLRCRNRGETCVYPAARDLDGMRFPDYANASSSPMEGDPRSEMGAPPEINHVHDQPRTNMTSQQGHINLHDADFWDPSVLASTNWLDALDGYDFGSFALPNMALAIPAQQTAIPAGADPSAGWNMSTATSHHAIEPLHNARSAITVQSTTSTPTRVDTQSLTGSSMHDQDSPASGQLYVHGGPARLPRTKRRKRSSLPAMQRREGFHTFSLACSIPPEVCTSEFVIIDDGIHDTLQSWYRRVCLDAQSIWPAFERVELPSADVFNHLIYLYFSNFDQVLPFMHQATLSRARIDPGLALAMAAIGSFYLSEHCITASFTPSLLEMTRRVTLFRDESGEIEPHAHTVARVRLLLTTGLLYSGRTGLVKAGIRDTRLIKDIHQIAKDEWSQFTSVGSHDQSNIESRWLTWCRKEAAVRLAHSAWLLDCMWKFHFGLRPGLGISDASLPLPCPEDLWNAETAQRWADIEVVRSAECKSLTDALSELYIDKRLPRGRGEFARIIMIHGLFHRSWEVEDYHSNPMSSWEPTADRQSSADLPSRERIWLPGIQSVKKWENVGCDAIDILHWQANATIGQASGLEHSTVLHLHLARIILLAPYPRILSLARAWGSANPCQTTDGDMIRRWAVQHQFKARLAAVHAGVTLWHVRRYSIDAFYEAPAVGLATLTLWAFSMFAAQSTKPSSPTSANSQESEMDMCNIILLDRPTDDELVQQFIRHDQPFQAHLTGVGDLYGPKGPQRVLLQGCKLLTSLGCWGVKDSWLEVLQNVLSAYPKE